MIISIDYKYARFCRCKKTPRGVYCDTGAFSEKTFGASGPPRRHEITRKKNTHNTPLIRGAIQKNKEKKKRTHTHTSHTHARTAQQQQVLVMSQPSSTSKSNTRSLELLGKSWRSGAHEGGHAGASSRACCARSTARTWAVSYLGTSGNESIIIAYTPSARAVINATPQCMLARYSFE